MRSSVHLPFAVSTGLALGGSRPARTEKLFEHALHALHATARTCRQVVGQESR